MSACKSTVCPELPEQPVVMKWTRVSTLGHVYGAPDDRCDATRTVLFQHARLGRSIILPLEIGGSSSDGTSARNVNRRAEIKARLLSLGISKLVTGTIELAGCLKRGSKLHFSDLSIDTLSTPVNMAAEVKVAWYECGEARGWFDEPCSIAHTGCCCTTRSGLILYAGISPRRTVQPVRATRLIPWPKSG